MKCYTVAFEIPLMVLAENEDDAVELAGKNLTAEAALWFELSCDVGFSKGYADGWGADCLVYSQEGETTAADALKLNENKEG